MKIELAAPLSASPVKTSNPRRGAGGRGAGRTARGGGPAAGRTAKAKPKTQEELDAELDAFIAKK